MIVNKSSPIQTFVNGKNALISAVLSVFCLMATLQVVQAQILPENELWRFDKVDRLTDITETEFNEAIDSTLKVFAPFTAIYGANLQAEKAWSDPTVNAYALKSGSTWTVKMFGGLARRTEVTLDAFKLVLCHEIGHHIGGFPFKRAGDFAASEGQADYFATQVCLKRLWQTDFDVNKAAMDTVNKFAKEQCDRVWFAEVDRHLCYRISNAGQSTANLMAALASQAFPDFEKPDLSVVAKTNVNHPQAQCRLDTYFHGAICPMHSDLTQIFGKSGTNGLNTIESERLSERYSCAQYNGFSDSVRPACWFAETK